MYTDSEEDYQGDFDGDGDDSCGESDFDYAVDVKGNVYNIS